MICEHCGSPLTFESAYLLPALVQRQGKYPNLLTCSKRCWTEWVAKRKEQGPQEPRLQPVELVKESRKTKTQSSHTPANGSDFTDSELEVLYTN